MALDFGTTGFTSNPYLDQQVQDSLGDTVRAFNLTAQPAFNAAMVRSGSFGNSGVEQMNQEAQRQLQTTLGRQANDMRSGNFWNGLNFDAGNYWHNQEFDRALYNDAYGQNMNNLQAGMGLLGAMNGYNQQDLANATTVQNTPLNYYGQFANQANAFGQGYGTQTGTMNMSGSPLMGALGGAQLGSAFAKNFSQPSSNYGSSWSSGWGSAMNTNGLGGYDQIYG